MFSGTDAGKAKRKEFVIIAPKKTKIFQCIQYNYSVHFFVLSTFHRVRSNLKRKRINMEKRNFDAIKMRLLK